MSEPAATPLGGGRYLVADGTTRRVAHAIATPEATWVHVDGRVFLFPATNVAVEHVPRGGPSEESTLASPMPATVVAVRVAEGQPVQRGDVLITLEAMKMELPIRAPRGGIVARVHCRAGDLVQPGVTLVEMAPAADSGDDRAHGR